MPLKWVLKLKLRLNHGNLAQTYFLQQHRKASTKPTWPDWPERSYEPLALRKFTATTAAPGGALQAIRQRIFPTGAMLELSPAAATVLTPLGVWLPVSGWSEFC